MAQSRKDGDHRANRPAELPANPVPATYAEPVLTRRTLVRSGAVLTVPVAGLVLDQRPTAAAPRLRRNPFRLGVASGEPGPGGFVIWTRLATRPLAEDGRGGIPRRTYSVRFQVATDPGFRNVVREGRAKATPTLGHSARVVVNGLSPGREYWYRWRIHGHVSQVGRAVTAPAPHHTPALLKVVAMSCSNFATGYFTAYRHAADEGADLMVHLGDYIYETGPRSVDIRPVASDKCTTLTDFRLRYAQWRTDPDLRRAHAASPWLVTFDDHEVENDYAGLDGGTTTGFAGLRARAYQAWFENQPVRWFSRPEKHHIRAHRRVGWGALANLHLLDTRQYRSPQVCGDIDVCDEFEDPSRTMLGAAQTTWLADGLAHSPHRWDLLAQQIIFSRRLVDNGSDYGYVSGTWDGYRHSQQQVVDMLQPSAAGPGPRNPVVLTGDSHAAWLNLVKADWDDPGSGTLAAEIGCTSITSGRDGHDGDGTHPFMADNPHVTFHNNLRGYSLLSLQPDEMTIDYRVVDRVVVRDSPVRTRRRYVVRDGEPTPELVHDAAPGGSGAR